ncbi:MAG: glycosyltransferase family 4 protein [Segetibacter sp.]|jgi:glycosyltransferase involved in cell wall biosynthesis|nr:glycosyltransferase family 4 protein [Segetibacter sp.]
MLPLATMRIAVDTRFLHSHHQPDLKEFTNEVFKRITTKHSKHHFIFFNDNASIHADGWPKNVETVTINPRPTNIFLYKWWYDVKLPLALKRYKADVFIATYGIGSLTTSTKQVLIVRDLAFLNKQSTSPRNSAGFFKRFTRSFTKRAKAVLTLSAFIKEELVTHYNINREAIHIIGSGAGVSFKSVDWDEKEFIKEQFAGGCEYFIFIQRVGTQLSFIKVLKAFSIFKKWQKTNMKLVIAGTFDAAFEKDLEKIASYKYREDVFIKREPSETELAQLVAASYALVFPSSYEGFAVPVLEALKCEVPVITYKNSSLSEIADGAALYVNSDQAEEIAEQMKRIFKDELLRNELVKAAKDRAVLFSWDRTAALLWQSIEQVVSK